MRHLVEEIAVWRERATRLKAMLALNIRDMARHFDWYLGGGKRFFERYSPQMIFSHKWCFIVGCNNSGTSLLQGILERSGQVSTMPHEGQRYTRVLTRAARRGHERVWTEFLDDLRMTTEDDLSRAPRLLHDWMRELSVPIRETIVEKTTANAVRMLWLQKAFPHSYFVGLVRNGYAVTEGIRRKGLKSVERGARHWNTVNKIMVKDAQDINNFLLVHYEDLVNKPNEVARQLGGFLELEPDSLQDALIGKFSFSTVLGKGSQPIRNFNSKSIKKLNSDDIRKIYHEACEMLNYFGYDISTR